MNVAEIIFEVREDETDGGYGARALGHDIFTQADSVEELRVLVKDAVHCHFGDRPDRPKVIRLHIVRDEMLSV
jgi:predicted RNase H-like HicB family nuclease